MILAQKSWSQAQSGPVASSSPHTSSLRLPHLMLLPCRTCVPCQGMAALYFCELGSSRQAILLSTGCVPCQEKVLLRKSACWPHAREIHPPELMDVTGPDGVFWGSGVATMVGCVVTGCIGEEWTGETWGGTGGDAAGWRGSASAAGEVPDGQMGTIAGAAPTGAAAPAVPTFS